MRKLILAAAFCALPLLAGEWTGYVSEDKCGARHKSGSEADINCVTACIKGGAKPVLVVEGKVVKIANPDKVPADLYGRKVKVTGEVKDEALTISTVVKAE